MLSCALLDEAIAACGVGGVFDRDSHLRRSRGHSGGPQSLHDRIHGLLRRVPDPAREPARSRPRLRRPVVSGPHRSRHEPARAGDRARATADDEPRLASRRLATPRAGESGVDLAERAVLGAGPRRPGGRPRAPARRGDSLRRLAHRDRQRVPAHPGEPATRSGLRAGVLPARRGGAQSPEDDRRRWWLAGASLGLALVLKSAGLWLYPLFAVARQWRLLAGAVAAALVVVVVSSSFMGWGVWPIYLADAFRFVAAEPSTTSRRIKPCRA